MSLAFNASPFNSDNDYTDIKNSDTPITRKKQNNNKTQKRQPNNSSQNTEKVNALLASIHNSSLNDNDMGDFNPPDPPQSTGVQNTIIKEQMTNQMSNQQSTPAPQKPPQYPVHNPNQMFDDEVNMDETQASYAENYYRKMIPNYGGRGNNNTNAQPNGTGYGVNTSEYDNAYKQPFFPPAYSNAYMPSYPVARGASDGRNVDIMEKLNYMINLLEENHDERTGSVTEEVILYSFLGIFIIFIADSFARVGKYTR